MAYSEGKRYSVNRIKIFIGEDPEVLLDLVKLYLKNIFPDLENLQLSLNKRDYEKIHFYAHKIKNSVDNFGISEVHDEIRILEDRSKRKHDYESYSQLVSYIRKAVIEVTKDIKTDFSL